MKAKKINLILILLFSFIVSIYAGTNGYHLGKTAAADSRSKHFKSFRKEKDTVPPVINVVSHADGTITNNKIIDVFGTVDSDTKKVTVNGNFAQVFNGEFSYSGLILENGLNTITVTATDKAKNKSVVMLSVECVLSKSLEFHYHYIGDYPKLENQPYSVEKILIIANDSLFNYSNLGNKIRRYAEDINKGYGCEVILLTAEHGNPQDIKTLILTYKDKLDGVVLIGDLPRPYYEIYTPDAANPYNIYDRFECDLFYMDLDGEWIDEISSWYGSTNVTGSLDKGGFVFSRIDDKIEFDWAYGSPENSIDNNRFSVRWTGKIEPEYTDIYTFYVNGDDGYKLWIDGKLLINQWPKVQSIESRQIILDASRQYDLRLEYYEAYNAANIILEWEGSQPFLSRQVVPTHCLWTPDLSQHGLNGDYFNNEWLVEETVVGISYGSNGFFDGHKGEILPEIFVGRIDTTAFSGYGDEYALINTYLDKNHRYWSGEMDINGKSGVIYAGDNISSNSIGKGYKVFAGLNSIFDEKHIQWIDIHTYNGVDLSPDLRPDLKTIYYSNLADPEFNYTSLIGHGNHEGSFITSGKDVAYRNNQSLFFHFMTCNPMRTMVHGCEPWSFTLSSAHLYGGNGSGRSLVSVGSTKTSGGNQEDYYMYEELGENKPVGLAFNQWLIRRHYLFYRVRWKV